MKNISTYIESNRLSSSDAAQMLTDLAAGVYNEAEMSSLLTVFLMRGVSLQELKGFRQAMVDLAVPVAIDVPVMDVCGTGGDGRNTFNISTASAFVVAAAGQAVAKHGNFGVSSPCGSSNVLLQLGIQFLKEPDTIRVDVHDHNFCYLHAPYFHPSMKMVAPVRKQLEVKTFFNLLGPLTNPARPSCQMTGVFNLQFARQIAYLLQEESRKFAIIHSLDGYDEISLTGPCKIYTHKDERLVEPKDLGLAACKPEELFGGNSLEDSAEIFLKVLRGEGSLAQTSVVSANAGLALYVSEICTDLKDAVQEAKDIIHSGQAFELFNRYLQSHKTIAHAS
jgi:anthranilate phosphoribosyltransferase